VACLVGGSPYSRQRPESMHTGAHEDSPRGRAGRRGRATVRSARPSRGDVEWSYQPNTVGGYSATSRAGSDPGSRVVSGRRSGAAALRQRRRKGRSTGRATLNAMLLALLPVLLAGAGQSCPIDQTPSSTEPATATTTSASPDTTFDLIPLDEATSNALLTDATEAEFGESVEILPGITFTVTSAAQTDAVDGYPLVAADVMYENRSENDELFMFAVVCEGTTADSTGQFLTVATDVTGE